MFIVQYIWTFGFHDFVDIGLHVLHHYIFSVCHTLLLYVTGSTRDCTVTRS